MKKKTYTEGTIAIRIWLCTSLSLLTGAVLYLLITEKETGFITAYAAPAFIASLVCSVPALVILWFCLIYISKKFILSGRRWMLLIASNLFITLLYGWLAILLDGSFFSTDVILAKLQFGGSVWGILFLSTLPAVLINRSSIQSLFSAGDFDLTTFLQSDTISAHQELPSSSEKVSRDAIQPSASRNDAGAPGKAIPKSGITLMILLSVAVHTATESSWQQPLSSTHDNQFSSSI